MQAPGSRIPPLRAAAVASDLYKPCAYLHGECVTVCHGLSMGIMVCHGTLLGKVILYFSKDAMAGEASAGHRPAPRNVAQPSRRRVRAASRGAMEHRAGTPDEPAGEDACATTEGRAQ
jgi:hypothetical protein